MTVHSEVQIKHVFDLAAQQIELYKKQGRELISHYNREVGALDGYRGRQLLELLQNADDAGVDADAGCNLILDLTRERLLVANTGKPFSKKGIESLVISDCSPKQLEQNRFIGCKGLGFRSVLTWTDRPLISSDQYEIVFDRTKAIKTVQKLSAEHPELNEIVTEFKESTGRWPAAVMRFPEVPSEADPLLIEARTCRARGFDTVIVLPLADGARGNEVYKQMLEQIARLPSNSLLFCRHLTRVEIAGDIVQTWELLRQDHGSDHTSIILQQNGSPDFWDIYWYTGQVSVEAAEMSSGGRRDFEVAVAVPEMLKRDPTSTLCVYFPTHERLPCSLVMHATLETSEDRNRLINNTSNREVLRHLAFHVARVVELQANTESNPRRALELLNGIENADEELKMLGFLDALVEECSKKSIFPRIDGKLGTSSEVLQAPHATWLDLLVSNQFPEVLSVAPLDSLGNLLKLFKLQWFDAPTLKDRLSRQLLEMDRGTAGETIGRLLKDDQLKQIGVNGLLIDSNGKLIEGGCFFTPIEKLPTLPEWASNIRFMDQDFQSGLQRGRELSVIRVLSIYLKIQDGEADEYRFDNVARALIDQIEIDAHDDVDLLLMRWRELLRWIFDASVGGRQVLPQRSIKVITTKGTLKRATYCYLGKDYQRGRIVWSLYERFGLDEFLAHPSHNGLDGIPDEEAENYFLVSPLS